jgi:hypothetical protein
MRATVEHATNGGRRAKHANAEKDRWTTECVTHGAGSCKGSRNEASTTSTSGESTKATECRKRVKSTKETTSVVRV